MLERPEPPGANGSLGLGVDGAGGTYAVWSERDTTGAYAFRVHRLNVLGDPPAGWTPAGVRALSPVGLTFAPLLVPDGVGGTYVGWTEYDSTAHVGHLAVDGSLVPGWPARGLAVSSAGRQADLVATDDGAGGVLVAWRRTGSGLTQEIFTQRFLANGTRAPSFPAAGRALTGFDYERGRFRVQLLRDADRGFWVSFHTVTLDPLLAPSSYAVLHLESSGLLTASQPPNGLALSLPEDEIGAQSFPPVPVALAPDGAGGTFAFTLGTNGNVRAFHVLSSTIEDPSWPAGGVIVASGAGWPSVHFSDNEMNWPVASGDLSGGAWVGWGDAADFMLHASRVQVDGTIAPGWSSPLPIAGQMTVTLLGDPSGVYAASLAAVSCPHFDCYGPLSLVRVNLDGSLAPGWPEALPPYTPAPGIVVGHGGPQDGPSLVADGAGGVVAAWIQYPEFMAMRFTTAGQLAGVSPAAGVLTLHARFDRSAGVRVRYSTGASPAARIELFDVTGRRVASVSVSPGSGEIALAGTRSLGPGVFLARITTETGTAATKFVALH